MVREVSICQTGCGWLSAPGHGLGDNQCDDSREFHGGLIAFTAFTIKEGHDP
jgi:hypothetical protein